MAFSNSRTIIPNESLPIASQDLHPVALSQLHSLTSQSYTSDTLPYTPLPLFCSHCPGWICYAEKTNPQCLPYLSTTKSAQQIIGSIFKHILTHPFSSSLMDHVGKYIFIETLIMIPIFSSNREWSALVSSRDLSCIDPTLF